MTWVTLPLLMCATLVAADNLVKTAEEEMAARPTEAFIIARRAAEGLPIGSETLRDLFSRAARVQENRLDALTEAQVIELAGVHEKTLGDPAAARRVQKEWLSARQRTLAPGDAQGRLDLARLWFSWLADRKAAARLCQEALSLRPDLVAAERMLRHNLNYRRTDNGWAADREEEGDPSKTVRAGMTASEVEEKWGRPSRVSRQILYRRYLEQWSYDAPALRLVEFDCPRGQEPRVLTVHLGNAKP